MRLTGAGLALAVLTGLSAPVALGATVQGAAAGEVALSQCVSLKTTGADRILTARWMFAAMAKSPHISDLGTVSDVRKAELDKAFSRLLVRIVNKDCIEQVRPLAAANMEDAFGRVGEALGTVAMQELIGDKEVGKSLSAYVDYLSEDDFKPLRDSIGKPQSK
jgi:hypothetical protein